MPETGDCAIRLTRTYSAAPAAVWAVLTEPESLGRWLAPAGEIELAPGGTFEVGRVQARVRELEPERMLELDWSQPGEDVSVVRFELIPDGGGTRLVLDHTRVHEPVGMSNIARWTVTLERLESELRSGR